MKWTLLAFALSLVLGRPAHPVETPVPEDVDGVCGRLVSSEAVAEQGKINSSHNELKPLSHIRIRLFSPGADCCALVTPVAEVTTGSDGGFHFRKLEAGDYWVAATIGSTDYKVLVRYVPGKKASTQCSTFLYVFENGKLQFRRADAQAAS